MQGCVIWLTGMPSSGKSTLASALEQALRERGCPVERLDSDETREHLAAELGFSRADRDANVRRLGYVANLLQSHGVAVIVAAISPYRATRDAVREAVGESVHGSSRNFVEVHVDCSLEEVKRRDVKGLYKRALKGEIANFTGVSDPYEAPKAPEVRVDTERMDIDEAISAITVYLESRQLIPHR